MAFCTLCQLEVIERKGEGTKGKEGNHCCSLCTKRINKLGKHQLEFWEHHFKGSVYVPGTPIAFQVKSIHGEGQSGTSS